jgi:hypothetical protein
MRRDSRLFSDLVMGLSLEPLGPPGATYPEVVERSAMEVV